MATDHKQVKLQKREQALRENLRRRKEKLKATKAGKKIDKKD